MNGVFYTLTAHGEGFIARCYDGPNNSVYAYGETKEAALERVKQSDEVKEFAKNKTWIEIKN
jgi:hypothetical protein